MTNIKMCLIQDCKNKKHSKGLCSKHYYEANREYIAARNKQYYNDNIGKIRASSAISTSKFKRRAKIKGNCTDCNTPLSINEINNKSYNYNVCYICHDKRLYASKKSKAKSKIITFNKYNGCACIGCGESDLNTLSIDHIDGGGEKHRKEIGSNIYGWLKRNNYPPGFRVLCMNCQFRSKVGALILDIAPNCDGAGI